METITNQFLSQILQIHKKSDLFLRRLEAPELVEIDDQMLKEADSCYANLFFNNQYLGVLWDESIDTPEQGLVTELALQIYYIQKFRKLKPEIQNQLRQCEKFRLSDICKRNVELEPHLDNEIRLLESALLLKPVSYLVNFLNLVIKEILPVKNLKERCVMISEIMHSLSIYDKRPYLTLEKATNNAKKDATEGLIEGFNSLSFDKFKAEGEIIIFDRIKKEINKNLKLKY
jgi:hypothetical protein